MSPRPWYRRSSLVILFLLIGILTLAFWMRTQATSWIPPGQFTSADAYLYYWQADIISAQGHLPARDMHRWLPLGRDLGQTLNLYSYVLAYVHKAVAVVFPSLTLYQVTLYMPVICFCMGLGALCIFLYRTYGLLFSAMVGILLATLIGAINRSSVGFSDRDSWCLMLAILAVTSYLTSLQAQRPRSRLLWRLASGCIVFLGGISWEAFGFFTALILAVELWKFCTTNTEEHLKEYALWVLMFIPWLYLASPAYRSGYGFATHVTALLLIPPLVVFLIRSIRYLILDFVKQLRPYARHIAWFLTFGSLAVGVCYIIFNFDTFALTAYPFKENRLMRSIDELANPPLAYWQHRYGNIFIFGSLGLIVEGIRIWKWKGVPLGVSLAVFFITTFFHLPVDKWIGTHLGDILFFTSLVLIFIALGIISFRKSPTPHEVVTLIVIVWAFLWIGLARGGKRHELFVGLPLAFGTASLLWLCPLHLLQTFKERIPSRFTSRWVTTSAAVVVFISVLLCAPIGGYLPEAMAVAKKVRKPIPGRGALADTFQWMYETLPQDTVVAANWTYGSQLNVLGGVKTITDQDHYIQHWVYLYYRHLFSAQSEQEALSFLKTHGATHVMLTQKGVFSRSQTYSFIGSDANIDRRFGFSKLYRDRRNTHETHFRMIPRGGTPLSSLEVDGVSAEKRVVTVHFRTGDTVSKEVVWNANNPSLIKFEDSGVILHFDFEGKPYIGYYIPPLGWGSLAVKLFIRGDHSNAFVPVYPVGEEDLIKVKVWEIHYPPHIKEHPKYLTTEPDNE